MAFGAIRILRCTAMGTMFVQRRFVFLFIWTVMSLISSSVNATKFFEVQYASQADYKIFVVDYPSQADCIIHIADNASKSRRGSGLWLRSKFASQADIKIHIVKYASQADLKVFIVNSPSRAKSCLI